MIRDITLGQYYGSTSLIHRLDPRLKIIGTLVFIAALFVANDFIGMAICASVLALAVKLSKVPLTFILRGLKPILILVIFTFCLNIFMMDGHILWQWGFLKVTAEGLYQAIFMAIRLILLIIGSSLLTLTTKPISLTDGIERILKAEICLPEPNPWCLFWCRCLSVRFVSLLIWPWRWRPDVIVVERVERVCIRCALPELIWLRHLL